MNKVIKVNGKTYEAQRYFNEDPDITFTIEIPLKEALATFVDGVKWSVIGRNGEEFDKSDYEYAGDITDHRNGKCTIAMRRLSDLEKLIELHYGGIN